MKNNDPLVTRSFLQSTLNENLSRLKDEMLDAFREYRDQILERMDKDAAELEQIREDQVFMHHDSKDHEERIAALEKIAKIV